MSNNFKQTAVLANILLLSIITFQSVYAQDEGLFWGAGYLMLGGSAVDLDDINSQLMQQGFPVFSETFFSLGGGGHAIIGRIVIGGEGHVLLSKSEDSERYQARLSSGYGFFNIGFTLLDRENFFLYPLLGVGGGTTALRFTENGSATFEELLKKPGRMSQISQGSFLLSPSMGIDYLLNISNETGKRRGFLVGVRLGYNIPLATGGWDMDEFQIVGGPDAEISGPFVRILIGAGGPR